MWTLEQLIRHTKSVSTEITGKWVPARPVRGPWIWRLKDAIKVLRGKAEAFTWPEDQ